MEKENTNTQEDENSAGNGRPDVEWVTRRSENADPEKRTAYFLRKQTRDKYYLQIPGTTADPVEVSEESDDVVPLGKGKCLELNGRYGRYNGLIRRKNDDGSIETLNPIDPEVGSLVAAIKVKGGYALITGIKKGMFEAETLADGTTIYLDFEEIRIIPQKILAGLKGDPSIAGKIRKAKDSWPMISQADWNYHKGGGRNGGVKRETRFGREVSVYPNTKPQPGDICLYRDPNQNKDLNGPYIVLEILPLGRRIRANLQRVIRDESGKLSLGEIAREVLILKWDREKLFMFSNLRWMEDWFKRKIENAPEIATLIEKVRQPRYSSTTTALALNPPTPEGTLIPPSEYSEVGDPGVVGLTPPAPKLKRKHRRPRSQQEKAVSTSSSKPQKNGQKKN